MKYMILFLLFGLSIASCEITKRKYLPGYNVSWFKLHTKKMDNDHFASDPNEDQIDSVTVFIEDQKSTDLTFQDESSASVLVQQDLIIQNEKQQLDSSGENSRSLSESLQNEQGNVQLTKNQLIKNPSKPEKKTKNIWKTVGLTTLITVLVFLFLWAGAMWPDVFMVWIGLSSLLALTGINSSIGPGSWKEQVFGFLLLASWACIYILIAIYAYPIWQGMLLQVLFLAAVFLIGSLYFYLEKKIKIKKREKSMGNIGGEKM